MQPDDFADADLARQVDAACDEFEEAWHTDDPKRIEDFIDDETEPLRRHLLLHLLQLEFHLRMETQQTPSVSEYIERFADDKELVETALGKTLAVDSEAKVHPPSNSCTIQRPQPSNRQLTKVPFADRAKHSNQDASDVGPLQALTVNAPRVVLRQTDEEGAIPIRQRTSTEIAVGDLNNRYQLEGEIARGGMGAILKARDADLGRDLAIKVLLNEHRDRPEVVHRFVEEAQIGGQLQHPGIAPVYELGQFADQRPFFTMKLVKGETLSQLLSNRQQPAEERGRWLGIFEQICQTMAYAHSRGVIHRDLKSANIMVGAFGEVQVMDWGLAKVLSGGAGTEKRNTPTQQDLSVIETLRSSSSDTSARFDSQTQMGSVMGTPAYMPPEQALGEIDQLDQRADVFGLGAILCEMLTGKPPYVAEDHTKVFRLATRGKTEECFQRLDECGADDEIIQLAKHCLENEPAARPRDAGELADRVVRYQESVEAKLRESETQRAAAAARAEAEAAQAEAERRRAEAEGQRLQLEMQSSRRLRKLSGALAISALIAVIACGVALVSGNRANQSSRAASQEAKKARAAQKLADSRLAELTEASGKLETQANSLRRRLYLSNVVRAADALPKDILAFRQLMVACPPGLREWEWNWLDSQGARILNGSDRPKFTPDGAHLLTTVSEDRNVLRLWNLKTGESASELRGASLSGDEAERNEVWANAINSTGDRAASGDRSGVIRMWDLTTGAELWSIQAHTREIDGIDISPDGKTVASVSWDGTVKTWRAATGEAVLTIGPLGRRLREIAFSPDGRRLAVGTHHGEPAGATVWDAARGELLLTLGQAENGVAFSPNGERIATSSFDGLVHVWNSTSGALIHRLNEHTKTVKCVDFSPDGLTLASGGDDHTVRLWDADTGEMIRVYLDDSSVYSMDFSPDGTKIAAFALRKGIHLWPVNPDRNGLSLRGYGTYVGLSVAFGPKGEYVVSGGNDGVLIWDAKTGDERYAFQGYPGRGVSFSPDGESIVGGGSLGALTLWDISTGRELQSFSGHEEHVYSAVFSPDGKWIASSGQDTTVRIWETETGRLLHTLRGHNRRSYATYAVTFSPNGKLLASAGGDGTVRVWDPATGQVIRTLDGGGEFPCLAFSPDGSSIIAGNKDQSLWLWDVGTGKKIQQFSGAHANTVWAVAFSPSGNRVVSGDSEGALVMWDVASAQPLLTLNHGGGQIWGVAFSPNGKTIASTHSDGVTRLWETTHPTSDVARERRQVLAAQQLVYTHFEKLLLRDEVTKAIRDSVHLDESVRAIALSLVDKRRENPHDLVRRARVLMNSSRARGDMTSALRLAEIACDISPIPYYFQVLGLAQYRSGKFDLAIESLGRCNDSGDARIRVLNDLLLAMAHKRRGQPGDLDRARDYYAKAIAEIPNHRYGEIVRFHKETAKLFESAEAEDSNAEETNQSNAGPPPTSASQAPRKNDSQ